MLRLPSSPSPSHFKGRFVAGGLISLVAWALLQALAPPPAIPWTPQMREAASQMAEALSAVSEECRRIGVSMDRALDPNQTCLIGPEYSELLTSLGQLEAKRTSINPDLAGLMVHLLAEAGVGPGDRVAVGASGSFPGLLVGTLTAIETMGAEPRTILSLGASSFGATRPGFHLWDLYRFMEGQGYVSGPAAGVSLGGSGDVGENLDPEFRAGLAQDLRSATPPGGSTRFLESSDLRSNVAERMALYGAADAFVNIGGAEANLGTSPRVLDVPPGLATDLVLPPEGQRGVLFEMASAGVPVIHLLHLRGLSLRYGLQWDPLPLPAPGSTPLSDSQKGKGFWFWLLTLAYALGLVAVFTLGGRREGQGAVR
ncbi:MAG: poly-gamma-glutamate system protein [Gemmatimonadetes bacterium]|nr:poly-gamma-glutamate system protein [Gemmatimonadota bacterium]